MIGQEILDVDDSAAILEAVCRDVDFPDAAGLGFGRHACPVMIIFTVLADQRFQPELVFWDFCAAQDAVDPLLRAAISQVELDDIAAMWGQTAWRWA
jgi:hypothetical protein